MLSVIVPVSNGEEYLARCLAALQASHLDRSLWELIVVDAASTDRSAALAAQVADDVIRLPVPARASVARNRGAQRARGEILVFVDADVCVHPDALGLMVECLSQAPAVSAVFGAYDVTPAAPGFVSQYRNLLHHYVHRRDAGPAVTFWTGLGAVRRKAFALVGCFDDRQTMLEDVELGYRLSDRGYRIELRPDIQGTHLKRWTLARMMVADVRDRGVPWVRLLLRGPGKRRPATLNVRLGEKAMTGLMASALLLTPVWIVSGVSDWEYIAGAALALLLAGNMPFTVWLARERGWLFALGSVPLRLLYYVLNVVSLGVGVLSLAWPARLWAPRAESSRRPCELVSPAAVPPCAELE
jgi:hypothetical protein